MTDQKHDKDCAYHCDQNEWECNCGAYVHRAAPSTPTAQVNAEMLAALREIAEGRGRYSLDQFEHARNTIEDMKEIARVAIARAEQMQGDQIVTEQTPGTYGGSIGKTEP